ncbi:hypothetical protein E3N88_20439 [Mikania micrantha]|uniref:RING-type E3 ubiquitin transferase n=1 Tax=Mikania micrantha TaxID=192012 RepID=A0A5N6NGZ8_9ASTR|nr:hypothetical protein E3N88_20439 [Mikania micrantha]
MASTTQKIIPMTRFSISEDEEEAPIIFKRARLSELASQWQGSVLPSQSRAAVEEDVEDEDFLPIDDVESDSQAPGETEDDEESDTEEDDDASDHEEAEPVPAGQNQQEQRAPTASTVVNKGNGELQVVLTDPDVFDCPICFEPLCTPVFQCENGHIACSSCCSKVERKCPSCCMPIGYNRCRAIEKVIESVKVSCKNARYGCTKTMAYCKKGEHEQTCPHATCFCPHPSCPYCGSSKNLYLHFGIQHAASTTRFTYNSPFFVTMEQVERRGMVTLSSPYQNPLGFTTSYHLRQIPGPARLDEDRRWRWWAGGASTEKESGGGGGLCDYKIFKSCNPPSFDGKKDAVTAHQWLREMESVIKISECNDSQKVKFEAHSFVSEALFWWDTIQQAMGEPAVEALSWESFKHLVLAKFCPKFVVDKMEKDFMNIEVGTMTHQEYTTKFNEMSRLVPHLVTPEESRIKRYIQGFPSEVRILVKGSAPGTYQSAVELTAELFEEVYGLGGRPMTSKRKWRDYSQGSKKDNFKPKRKISGSNLTVR